MCVGPLSCLPVGLLRRFFNYRGIHVISLLAFSIRTDDCFFFSGSIVGNATPLTTQRSRFSSMSGIICDDFSILRKVFFFIYFSFAGLFSHEMKGGKRDFQPITRMNLVSSVWPLR